MSAAKVRIFCDSCADLTPETYQQKQITVLPLHVHFGDEVFNDGVDLVPETFFPKLASSKVMPSTSCPSPGEYLEAFQKAIAEGCDVVYLGLSSALSGSVQSARTAQATLGDDGARVHVVDTLAASVGQGVLVLRATDLRDQGLSAAEIAATLENEKLSIYLIFTVDTIDYLRKGGRISGIAAAAATLLDIKPVLGVDERGEIVSVDKIRGRKRAIKRLVEIVAAKYDAKAVGGRLGICQAQCMEEAVALAETLKRECDVTEVVIGPVGATIGTHTGPGCLGVFFPGPSGRKA